ncbi:MAG: hypothetical protein OEZ58_05570 [Gammaproteobacteria bacterium]|nr:hypothetical protein [Gammaproteobacteria bacterium]MDH5728435.1 hypothetical protein [Gammaproteobacteria bacterium]
MKSQNSVIFQFILVLFLGLALLVSEASAKPVSPISISLQAQGEAHASQWLEVEAHVQNRQPGVMVQVHIKLPANVAHRGELTWTGELNTASPQVLRFSILVPVQEINITAEAAIILNQQTLYRALDQLQLNQGPVLYKATSEKPAVTRSRFGRNIVEYELP